MHLDPTRRDEAIAAGWLAYAERVPGMRANYLAACDGWQVLAVVAGQEVVGALFVRDGVIHLGIVPQWRGRWASRRLIREMLSYGTTTRLTAHESDEFIRRIGFRKCGDWYEFSKELT